MKPTVTQARRLADAVHRQREARDALIRPSLSDRQVRVAAEEYVKATDGVVAVIAHIGRGPL